MGSFFLSFKESLTQIKITTQLVYYQLFRTLGYI